MPTYEYRCKGCGERPRGRPGVHRRRPHHLRGLRGRAAQGLRRGRHPVQGQRLLQDRQPRRLQRERPTAARAPRPRAPASARRRRLVRLEAGAADTPKADKKADGKTDNASRPAPRRSLAPRPPPPPSPGARTVPREVPRAPDPSEARRPASPASRSRWPCAGAPASAVPWSSRSRCSRPRVWPRPCAGAEAARAAWGTGRARGGRHPRPAARPRPAAGRHRGPARCRWPRVPDGAMARVAEPAASCGPACSRARCSLRRRLAAPDVGGRRRACCREGTRAVAVPVDAGAIPPARGRPARRCRSRSAADDGRRGGRRWSRPAALVVARRRARRHRRRRPGRRATRGRRPGRGRRRRSPSSGRASAPSGWRRARAPRPPDEHPVGDEGGEACAVRMQPQRPPHREPAGDPGGHDAPDERGGEAVRDAAVAHHVDALEHERAERDRAGSSGTRSGRRRRGSRPGDAARRHRDARARHARLQGHRLADAHEHARRGGRPPRSVRSPVRRSAQPSTRPNDDQHRGDEPDVARCCARSRRRTARR